MDIDWCLTCDCHFQGTGPYCSTDCQERAGPSTPSAFHPRSDLRLDDDDGEVIYHQVDDVEPRAPWPGNDSAGILAWAADIPSYPATGSSTPITQLSYPSSPSSPSPSRISSRNASSTFVCRPPKLLQPHRLPTAPTLCMSKPHPAPPSPSRPILTPQQRVSILSHGLSCEPDSIGKTSLLSGVTESSLATPASAHGAPMIKGDRPSFLGAIATQVRSWVAPSSPAVASPISSTNLKQRITATKPSEQGLKIFAHSHPPATLNLAFSSETSSEAGAQWHLSSTIILDAPTKISKFASAPPPRTRGRKLSRGV